MGFFSWAFDPGPNANRPVPFREQTGAVVEAPISNFAWKFGAQIDFQNRFRWRKRQLRLPNKLEKFPAVSSFEPDSQGTKIQRGATKISEPPCRSQP